MKENYAIKKKRENYASDPAPKYYRVQLVGVILSLSKHLLCAYCVPRIAQAVNKTDPQIPSFLIIGMSPCEVRHWETKPWLSLPQKG